MFFRYEDRESPYGFQFVSSQNLFCPSVPHPAPCCARHRGVDFAYTFLELHGQTDILPIREKPGLYVLSIGFCYDKDSLRKKIK